jgi:hypothetical protein
VSPYFNEATWFSADSPIPLSGCLVGPNLAVVASRSSAWVRACRKWSAGPDSSSDYADSADYVDFLGWVGLDDETFPAKVRADLLREVFSNPFSPPEFRPEWVTADVWNLAQSALDCAGDQGVLAQDDLSILADALEEAGCPTSSDLLRHLRNRYSAVVRVYATVTGSREGWAVRLNTDSIRVVRHLARRREDAIAWAMAAYEIEKPCPWSPRDRKGRVPRLWSGAGVVREEKSIKFPHVRGCWAVDLLLGRQ